MWFDIFNLTKTTKQSKKELIYRIGNTSKNLTNISELTEKVYTDTIEVDGTFSSEIETSAA